MGSGKGEGGGERAERGALYLSSRETVGPAFLSGEGGGGERGALYRSSRETVGPASLSGEGERGEGGSVPFIPGDSWASLSEYAGTGCFSLRWPRYTSKISFLSARDGKSMRMCRSNRPGRSSACEEKTLINCHRSQPAYGAYTIIYITKLLYISYFRIHPFL